MIALAFTWPYAVPFLLAVVTVVTGVVAYIERPTR